MTRCNGCGCRLRGIDETLAHCVEGADGVMRVLCDECYDALCDAEDGDPRDVQGYGLGGDR